MKRMAQWGLKEIENMLSDNKNPEDMKRFRSLTNDTTASTDDLPIFDPDIERIFNESKRKGSSLPSFLPLNIYILLQLHRFSSPRRFFYQPDSREET